MSNTTEGALEEDQQGLSDQNPNNSQNDQSQEWETMARAWLSAFPGAKAVSTPEVEAWIDSNHGSLPAELRSMARSDLIDRLLSIQNIMRLPNQEKEGQDGIPYYRFQRTDQWRPVYSWLESLDQDELVKSKEISDWLTENAKVRDQLSARHSRYHLMHYIKKCHVKILKRREKKKGLEQSSKATSPKVHKEVVTKQSELLPCNNALSNLPKDSDMYIAKRTEASRKYEILVELEKQLSPLFPRNQIPNK